MGSTRQAVYRCGKLGSIHFPKEMMNILPDPLTSILDAVVGLWTCCSHVAFILPVKWVHQA